MSDRLAAKDRPRDAADRAARAAVSAFLPKSEDKGEHKTPYLLFLGTSEIERFAAEVDKWWEAFAAAPEPAKPRGRGKPKPAGGPNLPDGFAKAVGQLLDGGKAADLALFGRMLADLPETNVDAACQVAHGIPTNKIHTTEMDYFTAVDDLKPDDTAGADMTGTVEFNSACSYRYASLDAGQLAGNLRGDADLTRETAAAFLRASVHAAPTGKQNGFAAHNPPSLVLAAARTGGPVSLANAFVRPVAPRGGESLVVESIGALDHYYGRLTRMYGDRGLVASAVCQIEEAGLENLREDVGTVERVVAAVGAAFPNGGGP